MSENDTETSQDETYVAMFDEYVESQDWITAAEKPLVFHARKLARQLDLQISNTRETQAAKDSAYLQAVERLNKRRPSAVAPTNPQLPGQSSVFDFMDEGEGDE